MKPHCGFFIWCTRVKCGTFPRWRTPQKDEALCHYNHSHNEKSIRSEHKRFFTLRSELSILSHFTDLLAMNDCREKDVQSEKNERRQNRSASIMETDRKHFHQPTCWFWRWTNKEDLEMCGASPPQSAFQSAATTKAALPLLRVCFWVRMAGRLLAASLLTLWERL